MSIGESMAGLKRTHRCTEVSEANIGEKVTVMGWVQRRRDLGGVIFIDLRDRTGILQIVFDVSTMGEESFMKAEKLRSEYVMALEGVVEKRDPETVNKNLETGTIEVRAEQLRILSDAETPPFQIEEDSDVREELRLKYRYLDLRRPDIQKNMIMRHKLANVTRNYMNEAGFIEVETPMLTKSTPEGARDYLVPSRVHEGQFYALPQSPQLFKQLLMLSGMDRYFQIAKCFRDEDLRADRQPEFTQIDMELSFVDEDDVIAVNEKLLKKMFKEVLDVDVQLPIERLTYKEAMDRFGSDKPDTRFGMELVDVSDLVADCGFKVFTGAVSSGGSVRGINAKGCGDFPRRQIDALGEFAQIWGAKGMAWIVINEDGSLKSAITKFLGDDVVESIIKKMDGQPGDLLLFCADKNDIVYDTLGNLRLEVARKTDILKKDEFKFVWVTEFPLFEWNEDHKRYVAKHHPFTSPIEEDVALLETSPEKVRARAYDICLNGNEIGGGSIRIHQRDLQKKMFEALGFTEEEAEDQFGFLLNAFRYGVPPHGGLAYGLDRIAMLMAQADSIRDVIAFPKIKDASCPMTHAPSIVSEKQLEELSLKVESIELE